MVVSNDLVSKSGMSLALWILLLLLPIVFVFCIWGFFDRKRYNTYREAQEKVSNFLRNPSRSLTQGRTLDQEIMEYLDSDKEDLGLDLKSHEWVYFDQKETKTWLTPWLWSRRLIVTSKMIYPVKTSIWRKWVTFIDYDTLINDANICMTCKGGYFKIIESGYCKKPYFKIKIPEEDCDKIIERIKV